ncbi:diguanylate cyclase domain-containing protein [Rhizobium redzepovicii]
MLNMELHMDASEELEVEDITRQFAEATNLSLISVDSHGDIEFVNRSACLLFGYTKEEMLGRPITIIVPERMRSAHMAGLARAASGETPNLGGKSVEVPAVKKDGSEFPIELTLSVWKGRSGFCAGAIIKDISERRERDNRLMRLASQDTLTGLHNRHQFLDEVGGRLSSGECVTVILIDLDGFKEVNGTHGHATGDALLQAVGVRLPYLLGSDAILSRLGGDEFAILLPGIGDPLKLHEEAGRILDAFRKPFQLGGLVLDRPVPRTRGRRARRVRRLRTLSSQGYGRRMLAAFRSFDAERSPSPSRNA